MDGKARIGINGVGTIGRTLLGILERHPSLEVAAVNDVAPASSLVSHLRRQGGWPLRDVWHTDGWIHFGNGRFRLFQEPEPAAIPWEAAAVDLVVEASGRFTDANRAALHLRSAAFVLVSAPSRGAEATVVRGVSDDLMTATTRVVSAGSCTTNCVSPLLAALSAGFGVEFASFVSIHAATNDQSTVGAPGREEARSFATLDNAFATSTGASRAVEEVLPQLKGRVVARSIRVPVSDGSRIELVAELGRPASAGDVLETLTRESAGQLRGILALSDEALSAADIRGAHASCLVETGSIQMHGRHLLVSAWYDNVTAFSHRLAEILERSAELQREVRPMAVAAAAAG